MSPRTANTAVAVHPLLAERWSPRSFDATHTITDEELVSLLEAARWAPSARNSQPWRFLVGRRGDTTYRRIFATLAPGNRLWAGNSSLLVAAVAAERLESGTPHPGAAYDTGLAVAQLSLQARALGLHAHQMGGFDPERLRTSLGVPDGYQPLSITAIGALAAPELLPQELRDRETAARERRPPAETFFAQSWGNPLPVGP
ncbi:nitroreductase family protein [Streptomyces thermocarboxydus]|jgi:nitroreductase|uniref:Nitroreductase family protein n=2 Tax=Streptomyces TaxID=1883 RepID=A0ABW6JHV6_STRCE|nr:nitroreductase family protein [Streptomyces sp. AC04842]MDN3284822.1 nitroreductase family protein [Streptomyces thermocarboxydus]MYW53817.1 oxidoreductase [Streptomyces sp. SID8376]GHE79058.1 oxidoreductase [Streptomyces cellulosae]